MHTCIWRRRFQAQGRASKVRSQVSRLAGGVAENGSGGGEPEEMKFGDKRSDHEVLQFVRARRFFLLHVIGAFGGWGAEVGHGLTQV